MTDHVRIESTNTSVEVTQTQDEHPIEIQVNEDSVEVEVFTTENSIEDQDEGLDEIGRSKSRDMM